MYAQMTRRLRNLLTALSLLLSIVTGALWARSHSTADWFGFGRTLVASMEGRLCLAVPYGDLLADEWERRGFRLLDREEQLAFGLFLFGTQPAVEWEAAGLEYRHAAVSGGGVRLFAVPWWAPALVFAAMPAWRGLRYWRRRRPPPPGHCPRCGYDLRATPGRCPERGTTASVTAGS